MKSYKHVTALSIFPWKLFRQDTFHSSHSSNLHVSEMPCPTHCRALPPFRLYSTDELQVLLEQHLHMNHLLCGNACQANVFLITTIPINCTTYSLSLYFAWLLDFVSIIVKSVHLFRYT